MVFLANLHEIFEQWNRQLVVCWEDELEKDEDNNDDEKACTTHKQKPPTRDVQVYGPENTETQYMIVLSSRIESLVNVMLQRQCECSTRTSVLHPLHAHIQQYVEHALLLCIVSLVQRYACCVCIAVYVVWLPSSLALDLV